MKKIIIITQLYPNKNQPSKVPFVQEITKALKKHFELVIINPIPWQPKIFFRLGIKKYFDLPKSTVLNSILVYHPKYFITPKIFRSLYGLMYFFSLFRFMKKIKSEFNFDAILCFWAYPDTFAGYLFGKMFSKKVFSRVHGSDINYFTQYYLRKMMIKHTMNHIEKVFPVANSLSKKMIDIGINPHKIQVITNGYNPNVIMKLEQKESRIHLDIPQNKKILLFVGNIVEVKGLDVLFKAVIRVKNILRKKDVLIYVVGDGILFNYYIEYIKKNNIDDIVRFSGRVLHKEVKYWMNACDIFCLPSYNEGYPNVLVEAAVCGKYCIASNVGDSIEIIDTYGSGEMFNSGDDETLSKLIISGLTKINNYTVEQKNIKTWDQIAYEFKESIQS